MLIIVPMGIASRPIIAMIIAAILAQLLPLYRLHAMNSSSRPIKIKTVPSTVPNGRIDPTAPEIRLNTPDIASSIASMTTPVGRPVGCCGTGCE